MKKFALMVSVLLVASAFGAFARDTRTSINYSLGGSTLNLKYDDDLGGLDATETKFVPFLIDVDDNWFTDEPVLGPVKIGFDWNVGLGLSGHPTVKTDGFGEGTANDCLIYFVWFGSVGASFLYEINEANTVRFTPGLQFNDDVAIYSDIGSYSGNNYYLSLSLNASYQHYFTNTIGLNAGFDADIPLWGIQFISFSSSGHTYTISNTIKPGFNWRLLAGVAIKLGNR